MDAVDINSLWKKTLAQIEVKLDSPAQFKTWFKDTRLVELDGRKARIGVKNSYAADWLFKKHRLLIQNTLSFVSGQEVKPEFIYDREMAKEKTPTLVQDPILQVREGVDEFTHQRINAANLNEKYTIQSFVVGTSNRLAHAAVLSVAENPGKSYNPLFIYGPTGLGKTHLIQAIGRYILDSDPNKQVLYVTTENFLNDVVMSIRSNSMDRLRNKYRKLDVLLIDDIQFISKAKETQTEFFNTFNVLFQSSKQIVITSDRTPEEIPNIEQRLISRFQGGMVADIAKPDLEERLAILQQKRDEFGLTLSDQTIRKIGESVTDSIRELEGAIQKINLYTMMKKGELTPAEVEKVLGRDARSKRKQVKLSTILRKVAREFDVSVIDLKGPRRTKEIAFARQVCMYILRKEFGYRLKEVAELLKRNDHTTAIHAIDRIESLIQSNMTFKEQISNLLSEITRPIKE